MNVSQINLQHNVEMNDIYATIKDIGTDKKALIGDGPRYKQLMMSSSNELELVLETNQANANLFMLHISGNMLHILLSII